MPLRYAVVEERGSRTGRLHWHGVLHFGHSAHEPTWRQLRDGLEWDLGHLKLDLVRDPGAVGRYLGKYMAKDAGLIRASLGYGRPPGWRPWHTHPMMISAREAFPTAVVLGPAGERPVERQAPLAQALERSILEDADPDLVDVFRTWQPRGQQWRRAGFPDSEDARDRPAPGPAARERAGSTSS